jgi:hypothetical protein
MPKLKGNRPGIAANVDRASPDSSRNLFVWVPLGVAMRVPGEQVLAAAK